MKVAEEEAPVHTVVVELAKLGPVAAAAFRQVWIVGRNGRATCSNAGQVLHSQREHGE